MIEANTDFIVSELLSELKNENTRKAEQIDRLHKAITTLVIIALSVVILVVVGFLIYLAQYDFVSETTTNASATGVYALVDSSGNVIAEDLTPQEIEGVLNSLSKENDYNKKTQN